VFVAPSAGNVSVVGDFNQWNPSAIPLRRLSDGTWIADVPLAPGRYAYAFVVDGRLEPDPSAPRAADGDFGVANSIIMIRGS
jgi:1,4-alpha-glucan branching enzyme